MKQALSQAFKFRHACKVFDPKQPIAEDDFSTILEAARLSPSSFGEEPWQFLVVQNPRLREKLKAISWGAQGQLATASHFVLILARTGQGMRFDSPYIDYHLREVEQLPEEIIEQKRSVLGNFQENDFKLFESERTIWDWSAKQCYIPLANMMTSAALLGIDSCPIEGFDPVAVDALLGAEAGIDSAQFKVAVMVAFGYRTQAPHHSKTRLPEAEAVRWL